TSSIPCFPADGAPPTHITGALTTPPDSSVTEDGGPYTSIRSAWSRPPFVTSTTPKPPRPSHIRLATSRDPDPSTYTPPTPCVPSRCPPTQIRRISARLPDFTWILPSPSWPTTASLPKTPLPSSKISSPCPPSSRPSTRSETALASGSPPIRTPYSFRRTWALPRTPTVASSLKCSSPICSTVAVAEDDSDSAMTSRLASTMPCGTSRAPSPSQPTDSSFVANRPPPSTTSRPAEA